MTALEKIENTEVTQATDPMVSMIERIAQIAMNPDLPLERLEKMMDMQERLLAKDAERAFAVAFAKMQSALPVIPERGAIKNRDKEVQSTYPLWEDVLAALREPLSSNGLSMSFDRRKEDGATVIGCIVTHASGHSRRAEIDLPRDTSGSKNDVQGEGSTVSYGQRYSSKMLINWVSEGTDDDDGRSAGMGKTVTADQYVILRDLIAETGTDEIKFFTAHGHTDPQNAKLDDFPARLFEAAKAQLERKKAQQAAQ